MRSYYSYLIGVIYGQVRVDEDEQFGYRVWEGEGIRQRVPCYRVGVEDDSEK